MQGLEVDQYYPVNIVSINIWFSQQYHIYSGLPQNPLHFLLFYSMNLISFAVIY